ncbi:MAG: hypothetical protein ACOX9C_09620 [Kiritimatiellia bacterium]|jgi:hypothetical protein
MSDEQDKADFLDGFTLSPDWAKASSDSHAAGNMKKYAFDDEGAMRDDDRRRGGGRGGGRDGGGRRDDRRRDSGRRRDDGRRDFDGRRDERRRDERRRDGESGDRVRRRDGAPPQRMPPRDADGAPPRRGPSDGRRPRRDSRRRGAGPREPLPFDIRFLPNQRALSVIAQKIQAGHRALPLRSLVKLFFDNPDSTEVRLEFTAEHRDRRFHQCTACGWFSMSEDELKGHLISKHFSDWFEAEEIDVEPPSGSFTSVARCGFTGKLLAPPNHHSYNKRIQAMLRSECAGRSEEEYRARIELISDPETIEQWRQEASKQTVYFRKPEAEPAKPRRAGRKRPEARAETAPAKAEDEAEPEAVVAPEAAETETQETPAETEAVETTPDRLAIEAAEELFLREIAPSLMRADKQVTATNAATKTMDDRFVLNAISSAWSREQVVQTASLFFAVRGGLRSRKLALFRASDPHREEFVMHRQPVALDAQHAVPELRAILDYIALNPGCTRTQMLADIIPDDMPADKAEAIHKQLAFVTERGYVIEYFNGMLALPEEHPYFAHLPKADAPAKKETEPKSQKAEKKAGAKVQGSGKDPAPEPAEAQEAEAAEATAEAEPEEAAEATAEAEPEEAAEATAEAEPEEAVEAAPEAAAEPETKAEETPAQG